MMKHLFNFNDVYGKLFLTRANKIYRMWYSAEKHFSLFALIDHMVFTFSLIIKNHEFLTDI